MYMESISITNFKCFGTSTDRVHFCVPDGKTRGSGLNTLVGENNSGKSTLFEAVQFFREGPPRGKSPDDLKNKWANPDDPIDVDVVFGGPIESTITDFAQKNKQEVLTNYIYGGNGKRNLRISRSSVDHKELRLWNEVDQSFKNETGIAAPIQRLFEFNFVWADTNPQDETKFGSTTICGKLLSEIARTFADTQEFRDFQHTFSETFNSEGSGLRVRLKEIEQRTQEVFESQFGKARITFHFDELKTDGFFKNVHIKVDDGLDLYLDEKGTGMQRSVALALIQVYAENLAKHPTADTTKPFFLFIDEPETCLHPQGQLHLLKALMEISKTQQI